MSFNLKIKFFIAIFSVCFLTNIEAKEQKPWVEVKNPSELPFFGDLSKDDKKDLMVAINESLAYLNRSSSIYQFPKWGITHERTKKSLEHFKAILNSNLSAEELDRKIKNDFVIYKSIGREDKKGVLFTGYFEPLYLGKLEPDEQFCYPLYKTPSDMVLNKKNKVAGRLLKNGKVVPQYWTRQEIDEKGVLKGKKLELVYLNNPYDVYMAQFQGSVAVQLPDGDVKRYGYSSRNCSTVGFSLALELLKEGVFTKQQLLPSIIGDYFYQNPQKLSHYLQKNPSYVFFLERKKGPMGALSVFLQAERAISTDNRLFPKAALAFVDLKLYKDKKNYPFKKFVLNQDTGGAVMGPGRCEIFFGTGEEAQRKASDMFSVGQLYFFFLKTTH